MKTPKTDATQFSNDVRVWLHQFLDSNYFYQASNITPYIHVLVYHIPEIMRIHHHFGSAVEKKNHQVSYFFKKTTKDGGTGKERKSAIVDILEHENRVLYFNNHSEIESIQLQNVYASSKNDFLCIFFVYIFFLIISHIF
jgi:hypothetical protein